MPLATRSTTSRDEAGGPAVGFVLACLAVPAGYAAAGYYFATCGLMDWPPAKTTEFSALCGVPLFLGGLMQWWDVWVRPAPKLGANWTPITPSRHVAHLFAFHATVLLVAAYLIVASDPSSPLNLARTWQAIRANFEPAFFEQMRQEELRRQLAFPQNKPEVHEMPRCFNYPFGYLLMLAGLIGTLRMPRRAGFTSGQSIQN